MNKFGVSTGNVEVHHGSYTAKVDVERRVKIAELVPWALILGLGVLAAALIGFDNEVKVSFSTTKKAKFTDMKSLMFEFHKSLMRNISKKWGISTCFIGDWKTS